MNLIAFERHIERDEPKYDSSVPFGSPKVRREQVRVDVRIMDGSHIEGFVHVPPFTRPLDFLNQREDAFIAVTSARLTEPGEEPKDLDFLAVCKAQIVRMYEIREQ